jgi:phosphoribosylformylglycinamidine synthase subunit PurQ / glutaminase
MRERPRACVLQVDGVNCDRETADAWKLAGGEPEFVHINDFLLTPTKRLKDYQALLLSGGFSYGDYLKAGTVFGQELIIGLGDQLREFVHKGGMTLGICNGFQVLVRCGMLPKGRINTPDTMNQVDATLINNSVGHFRADWVNMVVEKDTPCEFLRAMPNRVKYMVAHGEGRFHATSDVLSEIEAQKLVAFRYVDRLGAHTMEYPMNPNNSINAIAGVCDPSGRILGLMPHPERFVLKEQYDNWRREDLGKPHGLVLFEAMVKYARES